MDGRTKKHWAIWLNNQSDTGAVIAQLLKGRGSSSFLLPPGGRGALFSKLELDRLVDEEDRHDKNIITPGTTQSLVSMSSGEQKKALLEHILRSRPDFVILDNPFDNLDAASQSRLRGMLQSLCQRVAIVQLMSRQQDLLPFIDNFASIDGPKLIRHQDLTAFQAVLDAARRDPVFAGPIPPPLTPLQAAGPELISLQNVSVSFAGRTVLRDINWTINSGEFWQLTGKNGSGKTTLLTMITGDSSKGYGQELYIFGQKKGSGESVWEIKRKMGYFTPAMTAKFTRRHSVEFMLLSGLYDSVGLYTQPTMAQRNLARDWLKLIGMWQLKDSCFTGLSMGQQRLLMVTRAMIKHPLLLILDEPTVGLDDASAALFVALVNKIAREGTSAIIFVSHRQEPGLKPRFTYELAMTQTGSTGTAIRH